MATYSYTDDQNKYLASLDYGNGDKLEYKYDDYGRLEKQTYEDGDTVTYQYDNDGALAAVTDSASGITTRYYYDFSGRSTGYSETGTNFNHTVGYKYDEINNLTTLVENINGVEKTTSYTYDKDNRTTSITTDGTTVDYTYDAYGRVTQQATKNGDTVILTEVFTFKDPSDTATSSQVETYKTYKGALSDGNLIAQYSYTYDNNGNILTVSDGTNVTKYTYDAANQLIREDNQKAGKTYTWTYDNAGNIKFHYTYDYAPNTATAELASSKSVEYKYEDDEWGDLLTKLVTTDANGTTNRTISHDGIGNPTNDGNRTYTWEHGRQLKTLIDGDTTWNYTYNNAGLRTGRYIENGATYKYIYDGSKLVQMTKDNQTVDFTYDVSGTPLTMKVGEDTYYYVTNIQGDVIALVDDDGNTVVSYSHTAYGEVTITDHVENDNADINPLTYRGYVYDVETKLFYLQSRYYDPEIGRFINADGLVATGQGLTGSNMFAYCGNNPVNRADPEGCFYRIILYIITRIICHQIEYAHKVVETAEMLTEMGFANVTFESAESCMKVMEQHNIDSSTEKAHFLSQCAQETNYGLWLTELGSEEYFTSHGYSYKYRGSGYIQLTLEYNYKCFSEVMGDPEIYNQGADYVAENYAWDAAGWLWSYNGINDMIANGATVKDITRSVRGISDSWEQRQKIYDKFYAILTN